jgi:hypothetical protein
MTDDDIDQVLSGGDFDLLSMKLFHHVIRCAHRGASHAAPWTIELTGTPEDNAAMQKQFVGAVFRSLLITPDDHQRNEEITRSIQDTTTAPLDEGGNDGQQPKP